MNKGIFITIEGGEGTGKTTQLKLIEEYLKGEKFKYILTREPGGIDISEQIRKIILDRNNTAMDARTEALLYAASRRQHLIERVIPALKEDKIVICDRFIDSSLAYQGFARGLGIEEVLKINEFSIEGHMPNLTIYLDIEPSIGLNRINKDAEREINRLDLERNTFHEKVREGYHILIERYPDRIKQVDANQTIERVFEDIKLYINDILKLNSK
ncbi:dTMP kinase [Candidatus Clostridium radicumherbarum]|uniref:Thymidylate kinase n=1 Tax=Candidatus Clostridium radicumherbarum TaxID=3381662 RepID=A0ABW8TY48_9CLOT